MGDDSATVPEGGEKGGGWGEALGQTLRTPEANGWVDTFYKRCDAFLVL